MHIGVFGDFNPQSETHIATDRSLEFAAAKLGIDVRAEWIPARQLGIRGQGL